MSEKLNILFVDDEECVLRSLNSLFKRNFKVYTTTDVHKALEFLKKNTVHVIVSDQRMPQITGVELLAQVKQVSPKTMRLLLTGYSDLQDIIDSVNEGEIYRYINKPWNNDHILNIVAKAAQVGLEQFQASTPSIVESGEKACGILVFEEENNTYDTLMEIADQKYMIKKATTLSSVFDMIKPQNEIAVIFLELKGDKEKVILKMIKQSRPNILIIALTNIQDANLLIDLINQGEIFRFFPIPVNKTLLERALKAAKQRFIVTTLP